MLNSTSTTIRPHVESSYLTASILGAVQDNELETQRHPRKHHYRINCSFKWATWLARAAVRTLVASPWQESGSHNGGAAASEPRAMGGGGMISDGPPESVRVGTARLRRWMARPRDGDRRERTAWVRRPPGEGRFPTSGTAQAGGFLWFLLYLVPLSRPSHQAGKDAFSLVDRTS